MPGEFEFIDWIRSQEEGSRRLVLPPGDDLAALQWDEHDLLLVGADQVLDGVHFDSGIHSPRDIGRKAMNRNLSDCAAMACLPAAAIVTVALPRGISLEYAQALYAGMQQAGASFDCPIVGGDTGSWPGRLAISVAILGRSAGIEPVRRAGAQPGDGIFVTGPLGGSLLGRHMSFEPRIAEARALAGTGRVTAMIDLSDGLSRDLAQVCRASGVGAVIHAEQIPIHEDALRAADHDGLTAIHHALHDGEDYELLFTAPAGSVGTHRQIGTINAEPGICLHHPDGAIEPLEPAGWQHHF